MILLEKTRTLSKKQSKSAALHVPTRDGGLAVSQSEKLGMGQYYVNREINLYDLT